MTLKGDLIRGALMELSKKELGWMSYLDLANMTEELIRSGSLRGTIDVGVLQVAQNLKLVPARVERRVINRVKQVRFVEAG